MLNHKRIEELEAENAALRRHLKLLDELFSQEREATAATVCLWMQRFRDERNMRLSERKGMEASISNLRVENVALSERVQSLGNRAHKAEGTLEQWAIAQGQPPTLDKEARERAQDAGAKRVFDAHRSGS